VARGKSFRHVNMKSERLSNQELTDLITGRSGTLRAPAICRGKTLIVGYSDALYEKLFV
jgi:arsenate reductase-like glutaredoxin family protein